MLPALRSNPPKAEISEISLGREVPQDRPWKSLTDHEVMDRLADGQCEALSALYDRYASLLQALALKILRNRQDAEEVVQEAFLYAWRRAESYDAKRSSVSSWLVVITRSRSLDRLRSCQRVETMRSEIETRGDQPKSLPSEGFSQVLSCERAKRMRKAIALLPPPQRQVLEFSYYRGWTQKEVAEKTGVPIGTVKTRTFLALKKLRQELADDLAQLM